MKSNTRKLIIVSYLNILKRLLPEHIRPYNFFLLKWMLAGYLIRVLVAPLFVSVDFVVLLWRSFIYAQTHKLVPMGDPPIISFIMGALLAVVSFFLPLQSFNDVVSNTRYSPFVTSVPIRMSYNGVHTLLFITKMPYLVMDLALAILLLRLVDDSKKSVLAFKLWCVNPIAIFISFVIGQYDVFPVFFVMLSLYFLKVERPNWSAISLGIAAAFKLFAFPMLLPLALIVTRRQRMMVKRITAFAKFCLIGLIPLLVSVISYAPYYESVNAAYTGFEYYNGFLGSRVFIPWYDISDPLLADWFIFGIDFSSEVQLFQSVTIYTSVIVYGLLFFACAFYQKWNFARIWKVMFIVFLMYYAFSHFHSQWFLWGQPFFIMFVVEDRKFHKMLLPFILFYFIYNFYWDYALTSALLIPIVPQAWIWLGPLGVLEGLGLPAVRVMNIFRSLFSALCIFTSFLVLKSVVSEPASEAS